MMEMERLKAQEEKHYWEDVEMEMERLRGGDMVQEPAQEVAQVEVQEIKETPFENEMID